MTCFYYVYVIVFDHGFEHDFEHGFEYSFEYGFEYGFEHDFEHDLKSEHRCYFDEFISFIFYITSFFKAHLGFYFKVFFDSCECFELQ